MGEGIFTPRKLWLIQNPITAHAGRESVLKGAKYCCSKVEFMADIDHYSMHILQNCVDRFKVYRCDLQTSIKPCAASIAAKIRQENENCEY